VRRTAGQSDDRSPELTSPPPLPLPEDEELDLDADAIRERVARRLFGAGPPEDGD
jgi:hypothetical protein